VPGDDTTVFAMTWTPKRALPDAILVPDETARQRLSCAAWANFSIMVSHAFADYVWLRDDEIETVKCTFDSTALKSV
jgi:hypothetical protein